MDQSAILAKEKAESLGLTMTSSWRSKAKEASLAGGSVNSMHTMGSLNDPKAYDYAGSKTAMAALAAWAKESGMFTEVIYNSPGHYNHVHLGWAQGKHKTPYYYINGEKTTGDSKIGESVDTSGVSRTWTEDEKGGFIQNIVTIIFVIFFIVVAAAFFLQAFPQVTTATNKAVKSVKKASSNVKKVTKAVKKKKGGGK